MRARVTNMAASARGFHTANGSTAMVEPGASALLELAGHPAHAAWAAAGEVTIEPEPQAGPDGQPFSRAREKAARHNRAE